MPEVGEGGWEARDLEELRAREASYRERLAHQAALAKRLTGYAEALQRMLRGRPPSRAYLASTLLEVAKLSSVALSIERTSIWLFDDARQYLSCTTLLTGQESRETSGLTLAARGCPRYIAALGETHALAVENVYTDPRTVELETYLREHRIGALLDIPIVIPGGVLGVVCHEHVTGPRMWHREEIDFAANVGSLVALALETERRLTAEYTALGTEAKYRHLVESLPVTVYSFDIHTTKLDYVSPHAAQWSGWTPEQWLRAGAQHWVERVHPEDRAAVAERLQPGALSGLPPEITYRVQLPNGQTRWVRDTTRFVRNPLGQAIALQGVLCDVTAQIESELQRSELVRQQKFMLDNAELHAVMIDATGKVTFVNDYFCRATGFTSAEVIGQNWFEYTTPPSQRARMQQELEQSVARGYLEPRMEAPLRTVSSEKLQVLWTNTVLRNVNGEVEGVLGLGVDMTQRIQLERELLQQTKLESLGKLAAGVAHDLNNLLAVMMAENERLSGVAGGSATMHTALQQAGDLAHSLLVYGRKQPVRVEALAVDELVQQTLPLAAAMAGDKLTLHTQLGCPTVQVSLDRAQLRQVILNLIGNAADATRGVGREIRLSTHLELIDPALGQRTTYVQPGEYVVLTVADDGRGMPGSVVARIFDPFFTTKSDGRGTGLGLAMCQSIVNRARGFIDVQSTPGVGTRFRVYLPRVAARLSASDPLAPIGLTGASHERTRILVVDDVVAIRHMLESTLREAGYRVFVAETVSTAAQILTTQPIDLLLTDGSLPDGSGIALAHSARSMRPQLKVILASGSLEADHSFDAVLLKPFDSGLLLRTVAAVVADQRT
jgi:PAS domain S-box-containing protein